MSKKVTRDLSKIEDDSSVQMGAKIANQINTNQQSNMALTAYCITTQSSSTVNINLG